MAGESQKSGARLFKQACLFGTIRYQSYQTASNEPDFKLIARFFPVLAEARWWQNWEWCVNEQGEQISMMPPI